MSDTSTTSTTPTDPAAPGASTTEYSTTKLVIYMGIVSMVVGFATDVLTALQVLTPNWAWIGTALMIAGKLTSLLKALGYDATRAAVKKAALTAATAQPTVAPAIAAANLGTVK